MKWVDSQKQMSGENGYNKYELIITLNTTLKCCRIYTQCIAEGKGAAVATVEAFLVGLGAHVANAQNFGVHLNNGYELDKEGEDTDRAHFATTSPAQYLVQMAAELAKLEEVDQLAAMQDYVLTRLKFSTMCP